MRQSITQREVFEEHPFLVPSAPMAFLWSRTSMLKEMWDVVQAVGAWPGVAIAADPNGLCVGMRGVTLGHLRWNGRIDLPFAPELGDRLVAEQMATRDPETDRVVFDVRTGADVDRAVWLLRLAYLNVGSKLDLCGNDDGGL
ncbi:MAG TPA: luciferase family protein [Tepidisphaeraceae bacterium]|nr:luciferase family protein [Tepidisphaeraceae bacterium]